MIMFKIIDQKGEIIAIIRIAFSRRDAVAKWREVCEKWIIGIPEGVWSAKPLVDKQEQNMCYFNWGLRLGDTQVWVNIGYVESRNFVAWDWLEKQRKMVSI